VIHVFGGAGERRGHRVPRLCAGIALGLIAAAPLGAQWQSTLGPRGALLGAPVGSDVERYVRALSIAGVIEPVSWGTRPLGADELSRMLTTSRRDAHPWGPALRDAASARGALGVSGVASVNSGFPWGANDGPLWQGRGVSAAIGTGAAFRIGPLRATFAPVAFIAQNASYRLLPTTGSDPLQSALRPTDIDLPQRFGTSSYARLDPGESSIRLVAGPLSTGISTGAIGFGPGETFPAILGGNAGGFPHVFIGTGARGVRVPWVGRFSGRYILGSLSESRWSPVTPTDTFVNVRDPIPSRRVGSGVAGSFMPSALPGLELGVTRFFHSPWSRSGGAWSAWAKPFEGILKKDFGNRNPNSFDPTGDPDNQLASFFARWVLPRRGVEVNFEYMREDHAWDLRDYAQEPEQNGAISAAIRVVTHRRADRLGLLTLEFFDGDVSPNAQQRAQGLLYFNGTIRQGHTQLGQILGTPIGPGAVAGQRVAWERFDANGSTSFALQRWRTRSLASFNPEGLFLPMSTKLPKSHDWVIDATAGISRRLLGRTISGEAGIAYAGVWQFDGKKTNLYLRTSIAQF
jgi:Capsule assembly protein Wzi